MIGGYDHASGCQSPAILSEHQSMRRMIAQLRKGKLPGIAHVAEIERLDDELEKANDRNRELEDTLRLMLRIKDAADGRRPLISNQGQGMDGLTELANYRSILESIKT